MKHGEAEAVFIEQSNSLVKGRSKRVLPTPDFIKDKPVLDVSLVFYWGSFFDLTTERLVEGGPIPYSAIIRYCHFHDIKECESFVEIIKQMDSVVLRNYKKRVSNISKK